MAGIMPRFRTVMRRSVWLLLFLFVGAMLLPQARLIPVQGADRNDWHPQTFWYHPWGKSGVHKGVDIFARAGTPVIASSGGVVLYRGELSRGGKVVLVLGPKWRLHYYAHLQSMAGSGFWAGAGSPLGTVGDSGNAAGKPPHLHYSLVSLLPMFWRMDDAPQGWKKMFFLDPTAHFAVQGEG